MQLSNKLVQVVSFIAILTFATFFSASSQGLSGVKNIPANYPSFKVAVDSLNLYGVSSSGITITVNAGYTETLSNSLILTATGTSTGSIIFQKIGVGTNPLITAFVGQKPASSADSIDVMWAFQGSDYVTIDGIDLQESALNTSGNSFMEVGYGFYKIDGTNGCNNNIIQNCTITLNRDNVTTAAAGPRSNATGSVGIEFINATRALVGTAITVTNISGASSNNKVYANVIQNCNFGILLSGFAAPSPYTLADTNNDVGGNSQVTGNQIINFGGGTGATSQCGAILINNQWGYNFSNNIVNNNNGSGINHPVTNRGIWLFSSSAGASGNINKNKVSIAAGSSTSAISWCLDFEASQSGTGNTVNIDSNEFINCVQTAASTAAFTAIWLNTAATTVNIRNNYIYGFRYDGTGTSQAILSQFACGTLNILNNIIDSTTLGGATATGTFHAIGITTMPTVAININGNTVSRLTLNTAGSGTKTIYGIYTASSIPSLNINDNTVTDFNRNGTTGGTTIGIYQLGGVAATTNVTVKRNQVNTFNITGTGTTSTMTGIQVSTGIIVCDSNIVSNLTITKTTATGTLYGIYDISSPTNENFNYNQVNNLTNNGTGITYGMIFNTITGVRNVIGNSIHTLTSNGTTVAGLVNTSSSPSISRNKIYNLQSNSTGNAIVSGIIVSSVGTSGNAQLFNNVIGDLRAPSATIASAAAPAIRGINLTLTTLTSSVNVSHNTVYLNASSTGANFGTTALFQTGNATATTANLTLRNNLFTNLSAPLGTGKTVAVHRSLVSLANFNDNSNRNIYYAGTPSVDRVLYFDGTTGAQTIADVKIALAPKDSNSFSENPAYLSTTPSNSQFLKVDPSIVTEVEGTGFLINNVNVDYEGNPRPGNSLYTGQAGLPDIGAFEADHLANTLNHMIYVQSDLIQQTGAIPSGSVNNRILRIEIITDKGANALNLLSLRFHTNGSSNPADITHAKVYYTGNNTTFSSSQVVGSFANPSGQFLINTSQKLLAGTNYFWLTYDISSGANGGNLVDAELDQINLSNSFYTPITVAPVGSRTIQAPLNGNYNVGVGYTYPTLTAAITDLGLLGVTGPVKLILKDAQYNTTTGESFPLTLGQVAGISSTNTITIQPDFGIASTIASNHTTATIDFNGGSHFIIDGRQGGIGGFIQGSNLIIIDSLQPALRFANDADSNYILYTDLKSNNAIAAGTANAGVVNFSTTNGNNGNDFNTIKFCDIHEYDSTLGFPAVGINSIGTGTTVARNNDFNTVDSCNIYNFFAASTNSSAFYIGANNSQWTLNGNKIYQTAKRIFSTGVHRPFWVTPNTANLTSASGFVITNNFVGGNQPNGNGNYEVNFTSTGLFNVMDISVGLGTATLVQNNTISNIIDTSANTASNSFAGINLANGNVNVQNNQIGSRTLNGAISFYASSLTTGGAMGIRTGGGTNNTFNISGNHVGGFNLYGLAASTTPEFFGINVFNGTNINVFNNLIGDTILANSILIATPNTASASLQRVSGIFNNPSSTAVHNLYNNVIANITNNNAGSSTLHSLTRGIVIAPTITGTYAATGNIIKNITTSAQTEGTAANVALAGILVNATVGAFNITGNTILGLGLTGVSTTASVKNVGIYYSVPASGTNVVTRNFVHSQTLTAANPVAVITGIDVAGGNGIISNNMIRIGIDEAGNSITTACTMRGITKFSGNTSIYFNTVYIGGSGVGTDFNRSFAFQRTGTGTDDVRNNIFYNTRTNASTGGGHFAVSLLNNTTLTQSFNLLQGDSIGLLNNVSFDDLGDWKTASAVDATSISSNLTFLNATGMGTVVNLRLDSTIATPIEAYGANVTGAGTDVDFDGLLRSTLTPVDLGADAGNFTPSDIAPPAIIYTTLNPTTSTADRTLTATITDATAIDTTTLNRPRIYFKKMLAGPWFSNAGTFVSGTTANSTWTFNITTATMGGLTGGDSVYYFIAAQDVNTNLGTFPAGGEGTSTNTITVYPNASNYFIIPILSGNINVGVGQTYQTLTGTNGAFNYLNNSVIGGNLTLTITSDIEEPGTVGLNSLIDTLMGNYTIAMVPDAATLRNITGNITTANSALIRLNGVDRLKIDGKFAGAGQYLRFMNRGTGNTFNFINDADHDTIANCIIEGMNTAQATICFYAGATGGTGNDSNAIVNCVIRDSLGAVFPNIPNTGIYSTGGANDFNSVLGCEIFNFGFEAVHIAASSGSNWNISNNFMYQKTVKITTDPRPIYINSGSGHTISFNSIGGSNINRGDSAFRSNAIFDVIEIGTGVTSTSPITISNNSISNIATIGTTALSGIRISAGHVIISNNTIGGAAMPYDTIRSGGTGSGISVTGGTIATVQNNTIGNMQSVGTGTGISISNATNATVENNTIENITYLTSGTGYAAGILYNPTSSATNATFKGNTIKNLKGNSSATSALQMCGIVASYTITTPVIEISGNQISNIENSFLGTGSYLASGIVISSNAAGNPLIHGNKITNIKTLYGGTGTTSSEVFGINLLAGSARVVNNQIILGDSVTNDSRIYGIRDASITTATPTIAYNSIYISGTNGTGTSGTYGLFKTGSSTGALHFNNVLYNNRLGNPSLVNFAAGATASAIFNANTLNNNLMVTADTARLVDYPVGTANGWGGLNVLYTTKANTNWATTVTNLPATDLFNNVAGFDLTTNANNQACWYVNGKGIALSNVSGDYNTNTAVRSTTIAGGATDIGCTEFNTTTTPITALGDRVPVIGDSTQYFFASRRVAKINWLSGIAPTNATVFYYSGVNPSNTPSGKTFANAYWDIQQLGNTSNVVVGLMLDSAIRGSIVGVNNSMVSYYNNTGTTWTNDTSSWVNYIGGICQANNHLGNNGIFTLTDEFNNPLPVKLVYLRATVNENNGLLTWATASEVNNYGFEVERSADGILFTKIGFVKGAGNSQQKQIYQFTDENIFAKATKWFYRLRQVDFNTNYTYSSVVSVNKATVNSTQVLAYPNPFSNMLSIDLMSNAEEIADVEITDSYGKTVVQKQVSISLGLNTLTIDELNHAASGMYVVKIKTQTDTIIQKVIKQ